MERHDLPYSHLDTGITHPDLFPIKLHILGFKIKASFNDKEIIQIERFDKVFSGFFAILHLSYCEQGKDTLNSIRTDLRCSAEHDHIIH